MAYIFQGARPFFAIIVGTGLAPVREVPASHALSDRGKPSPYDLCQTSLAKEGQAGTLSSKFGEMIYGED